MRLLVFAHRGEASFFIKHLQAKPYKADDILSCWTCEDAFLLVSGEGSTAATIATTHFLATHHSQITEVINLGVAASLTDELSIYDLTEIRTCYGEQSKEKIAFRSFSTSYPHDRPQEASTDKDCISALDRVLEPSHAKELSRYAPIVDRELWSIAHVCKQYKKPWRAIKIISDKPTNSKQALSCEAIADQAEEFSSRLFDYYQTKILRYKNDKNTTSSKLPSFCDKLYLTHSQNKALNKLLLTFKSQQHLNNRELNKQLEEDITIQEILLLKIPAKQKSQRIIHYLESMVSPIKKELLHQIKKFQKNFQHKNISFQFDPELEKRSFDLKKTFVDTKEFEEFKKNLAQIEVESFFKIMDGKTIDV